MNRIEMHAITKYSMNNESTIDIKKLILKCVENDEKGVAIIDNDYVSSFIKAEKILKKLNIKDFKLIYGIKLNVLYKLKNYKMVVLIKNKHAIRDLYQQLSSYTTLKYIKLDSLLKIKNNLLFGLIYEENNYNEDLLKYVDYIEVNKDINKKTINVLKKKNIVIYTNRINALEDEEILSKKVLYNKSNIKKEIDNRKYKNTKEVLKEINDKQIVIDNPNKIFNMVDKIELMNDDVLMIENNGFDIELLINIKLNEKYNNKIPTKVIKRVEEELKLIKEYKYEGYINLYKEIIEKCKYNNEEYVIYDYINYLYVAYLLGITHFDPLENNMNCDLFFSNYPTISIKVSDKFRIELLKYIKKELNINSIGCKGFVRLNNFMLNKTLDNYNNDKLSLDEKVTVTKYLDNYPINNRFVTLKELLLPKNYNIFDLTPRELVKDIDNNYNRYTSIDYKDIYHKFITLEIIGNENITILNELKNMTGDYIINNKDKNILNEKEYKDNITIYDKYLILDDFYYKLIEKNIDLIDIFNTINEIRNNKIISKKTKQLFMKNDIKLSRYHDINFINKALIKEKNRIIYELLYFKYYYTLEYYYILLKNNVDNNLIEIIEKGYSEILNILNKYKRYTIEYKCLNLIKEVYESNIDFKIEERYIIDDYDLELDKENNRIILIKNKKDNEINKYLSYDLSLVGTRPYNGKMKYISSLILKLLHYNYDITLFSLKNNTNYYLEYILSDITNLDRKSIKQYLNPCTCDKNKILSINKNEYMNGINYLLYNDLYIKDHSYINDFIIDKCSLILDKIIYMIKNSNSDFVIIDNMECINSDLEDTLIKLKIISKKKNIKIIIFNNLKKEYESNNKKDISSFENNELLSKYIDNIQILDGQKLYTIGE